MKHPAQPLAATAFMLLTLFATATLAADSRETRPVAGFSGIDLGVPANEVVRDSVAAVSVGVVDGEERLDLEYVEDRDADVDLNLVMTGSGEFIEVQGSGEEATFSRSQLDRLLKLGKIGVDAITHQQKLAVGANWPLD